MDGSESNREPTTRRTDLSALSWRARPSTSERPSGEQPAVDQSDAGNAAGAAEPDDWAPPEPWTPPEWTPPEWTPEESQPPAEPSAAVNETVEANEVDAGWDVEEPDDVQPTGSAPVTSAWAAAEPDEPAESEPAYPPGRSHPVDADIVEADVIEAEYVSPDRPGLVQDDYVLDGYVPDDYVQDGYLQGETMQAEHAPVEHGPDDADALTESTEERPVVPMPESGAQPEAELSSDTATQERGTEERWTEGARPADAWTEEHPTEAEASIEPEPGLSPYGSGFAAPEPAPFHPEPAPFHPEPAPFQPEPAPFQPEPVAMPVAMPAALPPLESILPQADGYREVGYDTVSRAVVTGEEFQPYQELGLQADEYAKIRQILGRRPTESELAMYSIMWSEHCSYKSSKVHLRQFAEKAPPSQTLLAGIGANAGVVKVSNTLAVTFKVESHNHPSFVEPHQGAATGVGGIVRDILAMGARPIGVMDPLRFGAPDHEDTRRVLPGVVSGIGGYGNCLGLPNIGGEVVFDPSYQGNPLVNALCVGVLPVDRLQSKAATGPGNLVVLIGAKTGRDGIGGVSVLASATFGSGSEERRPSVQVGDPFLEKLLIEACLEIYDLDLVVGIQDLGGAGLTCALSETAAAAGAGMSVNLDLVPLREPSMRPEEILASESQERMLLVVTPENLPVVLSLCARWGVLATAIGEVSAPEPEIGARLRVSWRGEVVVDVPPGSLADDGPIYARPMREPFERELMKVDRGETLPRPETADEIRATLLRMIASPNLCDKSWVTEQYDRYVLGNTVLAQPEDAGVLRIDEATGLGIAISVDGNGRFARLDPYHGTRLALAEAYRNVAVTGATPLAVTNCLNFGSPEDAGVMWQFAEAVRGLADGCQELGIPVTGGNVSFYNQTGGTPIHPTPIVGVLGVLPDVARRVPIGFSGEGDAIFLIGQTREELSGSEWAHVTHRHLGGAPPVVDLAAEQRLAKLLAEAAANGLLTAAHDLSDGGLAQALVEACLRRNLGAHVALPPDGQSAFVHLFSESTARVLVSLRKGHEAAFTALATKQGIQYTALGIVAGSALVIDELFEISLDELRTAFIGTMPALFD